MSRFLIQLRKEASRSKSRGENSIAEAKLTSCDADGKIEDLDVYQETSRPRNSELTDFSPTSAVFLLSGRTRERNSHSQPAGMGRRWTGEIEVEIPLEERWRRELVVNEVKESRSRPMSGSGEIIVSEHFRRSGRDR
jgi:hypothetical protein